MTALGEFDTILNLLLLIAVITYIARRLKVPRTIVFIAGGIAATFMTTFEVPSLNPDLFMTVLLPPILFEATLSLDVKELRKDAATVFTYAVIGTIITLLAVSAFAYFYLGFSIIESVLLGIVIAPTDPIAVVASFKKSGTSNRSRVVVEGEALFNDGVAIIAYAIVLNSLSPDKLGFMGLLSYSTVSIFGGVGVGLLGGYLAHWLMRSTDDKFAEVLISFLLSYGIYRFAQELNMSGVLAVVLAGLTVNYRISNYGGLSEEGRIQLGAFWEFVGFITTSMAFIFIGLNLNVDLLTAYFLPILLLTLFIMVSRYVKVFGLADLLIRLRLNELSTGWRMGLWWAGLRGAVSVVLVLSASGLGLVHIQAMEALTFGLVLATNVIWGITVNWAAKKYGLTESSSESVTHLITDGLP